MADDAVMYDTDPDASFLEALDRFLDGDGTVADLVSTMADIVERPPTHWRPCTLYRRAALVRWLRRKRSSQPC